jgi:hypothetical protein
MLHVLALAPIVALGPAVGVGGPLAVRDEPTLLRGFRFFIEGPGEKGSIIALETTVFAGGWFSERSPREVDGAELRFEGRLPAGTVQVVMGYAGGAFVAPRVGGARRTIALNAFVLGVRVPFWIGAGFADFTLNFFSIPTAAMKDTPTMPSPVRAGIELRPFDRTFVRGMGTYSLFYGNTFGWQLDAGVIF